MCLCVSKTPKTNERSHKIRDKHGFLFNERKLVENSIKCIVIVTCTNTLDISNNMKKVIRYHSFVSESIFFFQRIIFQFFKATLTQVCQLDLMHMVVLLVFLS